MADPLWLPEVVDTLVDMDLVDLDSVGPWPGDPEDADIYEPDWTQIHPNDRMADAPLDSPAGQSAVIDEVRKRG